jgi:hypothetical protein
VTTLPDPATSPLRSASGQRSRRFSPPRLRGLLLFCTVGSGCRNATGSSAAHQSIKAGYDLPCSTGRTVAQVAAHQSIKAGYDLPCSTGRTAAPSLSTPRLHRDPVPGRQTCENHVACLQQPNLYAAPWTKPEAGSTPLHRSSRLAAAPIATTINSKPPRQHRDRRCSAIGTSSQHRAVRPRTNISAPTPAHNMPFTDKRA